MKERTYIVYMYTFPNGKRYVGQTYDGSKRMQTSKYRKQVVYGAMVKYPDYTKEIVWKGNVDEVDEMERLFIDMYNTTDRENGYNMDSGGNKEKRHSEETKKKISNSQKGENSHMYGRTLSEETKKKISNAFKGNKHPFYGKKHTIASRLKMSESSKGFKPSEETKKKMSNSQHKKAVMGININTNEKISFISTCATKDYGFNNSHIIACCKGKRKTHKGYKWIYLDDYNKTKEQIERI